MSESKRPRVLQIVSSLGMGGAETWLVQLLRYWERQYANSASPNVPATDFLITSGNQGIFDDEVRALGARTHYVPFKKGTVGSFARAFRTILRQNQYCAIHDHQDFLSGWHLMLAAGKLPPVRVVHVHNPTYQLTQNYGVNIRRRTQLAMGKQFLKRFATHIGGTSKQVLDEYGITDQTFPKQWIGALHCAFPLAPWQLDRAAARQTLLEELNWPEETRVVLFAGRLDYSADIDHRHNHKNSAFALRIIEHCADQNIRMIMAGQNNFIADEFQQLIDEKGLTDRVQMLGIRKDICHLMVGSSALLFPSRAEGLGMVAVEAQAAGLPVLASSAVPSECVVLKEMVSFLNLNQPFTDWAQRLTELCNGSENAPTGTDPRWKTSPFNIAVCGDALQTLYLNRPCPYSTK